MLKSRAASSRIAKAEDYDCSNVYEPADSGGSQYAAPLSPQTFVSGVKPQIIITSIEMIKIEHLESMRVDTAVHDDSLEEQISFDRCLVDRMKTSAFLTSHCYDSNQDMGYIGGIPYYSSAGFHLVMLIRPEADQCGWLS